MKFILGIVLVLLVVSKTDFLSPLTREEQRNGRLRRPSRRPPDRLECSGGGGGRRSIREAFRRTEIGAGHDRNIMTRAKKQ